MSHSYYVHGRRVLLEALLITSFVLGLFYYWYGVANRYIIFLYGHTAVGIPKAQPFDAMTTSRYWMAGLVAAGAVMALYTATYWLCGRLTTWRKQPFVPVPWWQVWALSALPLSVGIPAITMTLNAPTLPPQLAAACVAATVLGLAIALLPAQWAATHPWDLIWLLADGSGLLPALLLLRVIELPSRGISISHTTAWFVAIGGLLAGVLWLGGMTLLRARRHKTIPSAKALFGAGLGLSYVLLPLVHYLVATPPAYRYITAASNFFAFNGALQCLALVVAATLAVGVTTSRRRLARGKMVDTPQRMIQ